MTTTITRRRLTKREKEDLERARIDVEIETADPAFIERYMECYDVLHAWHLMSPRSFVRNGEEFKKYRCVRCGTIKDRNQAPGGRSCNYKHPPGYKLEGVTRNDIREYIARHSGPPYKTEQELLDALAAADKAAKAVKAPRRRRKVTA